MNSDGHYSIQSLKVSSDGTKQSNAISAQNQPSSNPMNSEFDPAELEVAPNAHVNKRNDQKARQL